MSSCLHGLLSPWGGEQLEEWDKEGSSKSVGPRVAASLTGSKGSTVIRNSVEFGGVNVKKVRADTKLLL